MTTKDNGKTIGEEMLLIPRCKSVLIPISAHNCCSNVTDGKLVVNPYAKKNKNYFPDHEIPSVYISASENIKTSFSNKTILLEPSSVTKHDSVICSNVIVDDNDI